VIGVLLADDQALVRDGFRLILEVESDMEVVGEALDGHEALEQARRLHPDVVLMDIRMPGLDGLEATRRLVRAGLRSRVLMLTTFDRDEYLYEAMKAGASGFLLKDIRRDQLVHAIRTVAAGEALLAPTLVRRLVEDFCRRPPPGAEPPPALARLTERELDVLRLVARGLSNREIAGKLFLSEATIKTHLASSHAEARPARPRPGGRTRLRVRPRPTRRARRLRGARDVTPRPRHHQGKSICAAPRPSHAGTPSLNPSPFRRFRATVLAHAARCVIKRARTKLISVRP
jgi:DNA-binding NarL/FixJ family response regulator